MTRVLVPVASGVLSAFGLVVGRAPPRPRGERAPDRRRTHGRRDRRSRGSPGRARPRGARRARPGGARHLRPPLRGAGLRAVDRRRSAARSGRAPARLRSRPRGALRLLRPGGGARAGHVRVAVALPGAEPAPAAWDGLPDESVEGPAVVALPGSTLVVADGWRAHAEDDVVVMERWNDDPPSPAPRRPRTRRQLDPITLEVMLGSLRAACDEMGAVLVRSAHSANIKERRDASTGLFDADGQMVMQAEHIPVHLGAMPSAVAAVIDEEQRPGESWILNDPYRGGTHLPDITVITPLFHGNEPAGFAASRAHHADVGARGARQHAGVLALAGRRGRRDPAHPPDRRGAARAGRPDAQPAPARGGPPRAARGRARGRRARGGADRALRDRHVPGRPPRDARLRGAPHACPDRGAGGRHDARHATSSRRANGDLELEAGGQGPRG